MYGIIHSASSDPLHCMGERRLPVHNVLCSGQQDSWEYHTQHDTYMYMYIESHPGSSFFLGKVTALGVLCCFALFVCLTLLASFFLPSHLSFKNMHMYLYVQHVYTCIHTGTCICTCTRQSLNKVEAYNVQ